MVPSPPGDPPKSLWGGKTLNVSVLRFVAFLFILIIIVSFLCVSCGKEISFAHTDLTDLTDNIY